MKRTIISFLLLFVFYYSPASAQKDVLDKVREKFNTASTISADITQSGGGTNLTGKIYLKKTNKLRLEYKNLLIISDGSSIWNYNKKENKVIVSVFDENDPSAWSFDKIINEYPLSSDLSFIEEQGRNILLITPKKNAGLNFDSVRLWINNENFVEKIRIEKADNLIEIVISGYKLNETLSDSFFTFLPPEGTQIIDLR